MLVFNRFIVDGKIEYDTRIFTSGNQLIEYINTKFPDDLQIGADNLSRHKKHVPEMAGSTSLVLTDDNRLFRRTLDGDLQEIKRHDVETALAIIVSIGLDDIIKGKVRSNFKGTIDALKLLHEVRAGRDQVDDYDKIIADKHRGIVVAVESADPLDEIEVVNIPPDVLRLLPRDHIGGDEDDDEDV